MQGSVMTSTAQFVTAIERLRCSHCQARMMLERVTSGPFGFEHRLFECPKCDHVEISVIASDPLRSKAAGWLDGELRAPN
jgi:Zn finger protein HypA/HybF involved in hydrogenase expression